MAFVLKDPVGDSPGIIIFTHKERLFLDCNVPPVKKALSELRKHYVFGMHWGAHHPNVSPPTIIDFHLAGPGTVSFARPVRHIPLCSRNFTPACFKPASLPKYWDVINISRPIRQKRLDDFFQVIRRVYDQGHLLRVLLLCPWPPRMDDPSWWYRELEGDYLRMFSESERQYFSLMRLQHGPVGAFPLPQETIAYFYNVSKFFCLFSEHEGESRVIAEALLCGLPVVVRETLLGGGRDYLTPENSRTFSSLDEAAEQFIEIANNHHHYSFDTSKLEIELSERHTKSKLQRALQGLFHELGYPFLGEPRLDKLDRRLPGHEVNLPAHLRADETNDLRSLEATLLYARQISGLSITRSAQLWARSWDRLAAARRIGKQTLRWAQRRLSLTGGGSRASAHLAHE